MLLRKAENQQAYAKVGIFGFQGAGKTYTASNIAIGFIQANKIKKPCAFMDTETGSDYMIPRFKEAGIELLVAKTRAFKDILTIIAEAEKECGFLIIDSITHIWRDLTESFQKKLNRTRLQFQDWGVIKCEWGKYTDAFVNSKVHIITCGRAGYEYDYDFNEDGSKDLVKTGTKMKAEGEFGFEPSLVIEMERISENRIEADAIFETKDKTKKQLFRPKIGSAWIHRAHILKDRTDNIDGRSFDNPTYQDLLPHFSALNLGGEHLGVDTTRNSQDLFDKNGDTEWIKRKKQVTITLEEIQGELVNHFPGQSVTEKKFKGDIIKHVFKTNSWTAVEEMNLEALQAGLKEVREIVARHTNEQTLAEVLAKTEPQKFILCPDCGQEIDAAGCKNCNHREGCPALDN